MLRASTLEAYYYGGALLFYILKSPLALRWLLSSDLLSGKWDAKRVKGLMPKTGDGMQEVGGRRWKVRCERSEADDEFW